MSIDRSAEYENCDAFIQYECYPLTGTKSLLYRVQKR